MTTGGCCGVGRFFCPPNGFPPPFPAFIICHSMLFRNFFAPGNPFIPCICWRPSSSGASAGKSTRRAGAATAPSARLSSAAAAGKERASERAAVAREAAEGEG